MIRIASFSEWILRQPLVWGGLACLGFYAAIRQGLINSPLVVRYADSHVVEYVTIGLFFVGLAALTLRLMSLLVQYAVFQRDLVGPGPLGGQAPSEAGALLSKLTTLPGYVQQSYLVARLQRALKTIFRKNSADDLEPQLRQLEEARELVGDGARLVVVGQRVGAAALDGLARAVVGRRVRVVVEREG